MKSNRMFGILCILLEREKITAQELAEYFEVSVRTIHRDLLDLSSAGFPVTTQQGIGGGISLLSNFKYSKSVLNKEDIDLIVSGIQGFASIDESSKIKTLLAKLRLGQEDKLLLENDIIIDFTSWNHKNTTIEKIKIIRSAIAPDACWNWSITATKDTPKEPWNPISSFLRKNTGIFSPTAHKGRISVFLSLTEYRSCCFASRSIRNGQIMKFRYCRAHFQMAWGNWLQSEWINPMSFWRLISLARAISGKKTILSTFPFIRNTRSGS